MTVLLKILLILFGIWFIGRTIIRGIFSWFLGDVEKQLNSQIRRQQEAAVHQKKKRDGHVTINYQPKSNKNFSKEEGDYVDFEEVT